MEEKRACESVVEGSRDIQQHRRRVTMSGRGRGDGGEGQGEGV